MPELLKLLERAKGFEPSTPTLARSCSTPELHPHPLDIWPNRDIGRQGRSYSQKAALNATTAFASDSTVNCCGPGAGFARAALHSVCRPISDSDCRSRDCPPPHWGGRPLTRHIGSLHIQRRCPSTSSRTMDLRKHAQRAPRAVPQREQRKQSIKSASPFTFQVV